MTATPPPTLPDARLDRLFGEWERAGQSLAGARDAGRPGGRPHLTVAVGGPGGGDGDEVCVRTPKPVGGRHWHQVPPLRGDLGTSGPV